jgi:hypothetical protein
MESNTHIDPPGCDPGYFHLIVRPGRRTEEELGHMNVEHVPDRHRFVVQLPEGTGELRYRRIGPYLLDLLHTEVSPALRGHGVADALVQAAMAFARANGDKIIPTCPYVQEWLKRHPEEGDIIGISPEHTAP